MEKWDIWHQKAIQAGVNPELAQLGRAVIRDYWEHGKYRDEQSGGGPFLGANRHHAMMLALACQKPSLAQARFLAESSAAVNESVEEEVAQSLADAEWRYADPQLKPCTAEWYDSAYKLEGCNWDMYAADDHSRSRT